MPESKSPDLERLKLGHEIMQAEIKPYFESSLKSRQFAADFAKLGLQAVFALNGGALVGFPAFAHLAGDQFRIQGTWVFVAIVCYVIGLGFSCLATFCAYAFMQRDANGIYVAGAAIRARNLSNLSEGDVAAAWQKHALEFQQEMDVEARAAKVHRTVTISFWFLSLVFFICGTGAASFVFWSLAPHRVPAAGGFMRAVAILPSGEAFHGQSRHSDQPRARADALGQRRCGAARLRSRLRPDARPRRGGCQRSGEGTGIGIVQLSAGCPAEMKRNPAPGKRVKLVKLEA